MEVKITLPRKFGFKIERYLEIIFPSTSTNFPHLATFFRSVSAKSHHVREIEVEKLETTYRTLKFNHTRYHTVHDDNNNQVCLLHLKSDNIQGSQVSSKFAQQRLLIIMDHFDIRNMTFKYLNKKC